MNYYNEYDKYAAQWLRNLIAEGLIPKGEVDERSIEDVLPSELAGFTQCHFFAGLGGWSLALQLAGWPEDRPVWTGSCPCQPFSAAGKGKGAADERHLWPAWFHLIRECRPPVIFGEQVEAAIRHGWLDLVQTDMEGIGYAVGHSGLPAACVGAPHIRQRLWFVADSDSQRRDGIDALLRKEQKDPVETAGSGESGIVAESDEQQRNRSWDTGEGRREQFADIGAISILGDAIGSGLEGHGRSEGQRNTEGRQGEERHSSEASSGVGHAASEQMGISRQPRLGSAASHIWDEADWLPCRDGKARPVESGTFPLAHGVSGRVGRLRAYGNAIVPQVAAEFIKAAML